MIIATTTIKDATLEQCRDQFKFYAKQHRDKAKLLGPGAAREQTLAKADVNDMFATKCEFALRGA